MGVARFTPPAAAAALALLAAAPAMAAGAAGCCNLPQTHTVQIPGVVIGAPSTTLGGGSGCSACGGGVGAGAGSGPSSGSGSGSDSGSGADSGSGSSSSSSSSVSSSAYGSASAYGASSSNGATNSATVANLLASGGGSSFYVDQGPSSTIGTLNVEAPAQPAAGPVCLEYASQLVVEAVQATCLDDKDVPHPASQVMPGREVADGYAGEVFRCIAGSRMQYVVGAFAGQPDFARGQTLVCRKGDALWREAGGRLQCRPQTPARDCNERSLLRRYGAGIKVMRVAGGGQCVRWGGGQGVAEAGAPGAVTGMLIDGGVGGVAH